MCCGSWYGYFFAAWGLFSTLWLILGWFWSGSRSVTLVLLCPQSDAEGALLRLRWLNHWGFLRSRIILPGVQKTDLPQDHKDTEFCTLAELSARIEAERERFDRHGNGDPPGCRQRRGVSEL